jgi:putative ABC transport system permease protein
MTNVLARKLRRDLIELRGMLAAVVSMVAFGVAALVSLQVTMDNLTAERDAYYSQCRLADFWVDIKKAPLGELDGLADTDGAADLRARVVSPVVVDLAGVRRPISGLMIGMPEQHDAVINDLVLVTGDWFDGERDDQVIVTEGFAKARGILPGDEIDLIVDGQRQRLHVVGIGISAEFVYLVPPGGIAPTPADFGVFIRAPAVRRGCAGHVGCREQTRRLADGLGPRPARHGVGTLATGARAIRRLCDDTPRAAGVQSQSVLGAFWARDHGGDDPAHLPHRYLQAFGALKLSSAAR